MEEIDLYLNIINQSCRILYFLLQDVLYINKNNTTFCFIACNI